MTFSAQTGFFKQREGPRGSASASSKAVISCSFRAPFPQPELSSANPTSAKCPPPIPGPSCWCPACLRFSLLRAGVWGGCTLCVSRLVAERQQILIVPPGSGDRGGGWEGWRRHRCLVSIQSHIHTHARAQRGVHGSKLGTEVHPEHRSRLHNRCLPEPIGQSTSDATRILKDTKNPSS